MTDTTATRHDFAVPSRDLRTQRLARLRRMMDEHDLGAVVLGSPANVQYATGYRAVAADLFRAHQMVAMVTPDRLVLVVGMADTAPAADAGMAPDELVAHGRFYYERTDDAAVLPDPDVDGHADLGDAVIAAIERLGQLTGRVAVDTDGLGAALPHVTNAVTGVATTDAAPVMTAARSRKLPGEVERLDRAARLAEDGISAALQVARPGVPETALADAVAATMVAGGARPSFVVATAGLRTALADAFPSAGQVVAAGDLLRFDVGCRVDGYHSDMARTGVVGAPSDLQQRRYDALLAGEQAQLDLVAPGVTAGELFDVAVATVQDHGFAPYRRHHCGHAIGSDVYEHPIIAPGVDTVLEPGMTFCVETPYYERGWGGMMVEDTIVVTDDGHRRFTQSDRDLRVVPA